MIGFVYCTGAMMTAAGWLLFEAANDEEHDLAAVLTLAALWPLVFVMLLAGLAKDALRLVGLRR